MMGYDLLADVRQKAGVEDVELILIWQVEIGGEGVGEDGDHLGMADAAVQGLHGQDHIGRDLDEILHVLVLVREALRDLLSVLEGILDADDLVGLDALPPAFDVELLARAKLQAGLGVRQLELHLLRIQVQGALEILQGLRSEEHTSELQSQSNLVCRLLLEKKKRSTITTSL